MSNDKGLTISQIVVTGKNLKNVSVDFTKGVNVVYGPSDTGKTYLFELINYMFGASKKPKAIDESIGYEYAYLELVDEKQEYTTIERNLMSGVTAFYHSKFDKRSKTKKVNFAQIHNEKRTNNVSRYMLASIGSYYKKVRQTQAGKMQNFTYRSYTSLSLLDEIFILTDESILKGKNGGVGQTGAKSSFETIVSGRDDLVIDGDLEPKIDIKAIEIQMNLLKEDITNYQHDLEQLIDEGIRKSTEEMGSEIKNITLVIDEEKNHRRELEFEENKVKDKERKGKSLLNYDKELLSKFKLLLENYQSDLERIDFIDEANYYLNQFEDVKCPVCGSDHKIEATIEKNKFREVVLVEKKSLLRKISELNKTIDIIQLKIEDSINIQLTYNNQIELFEIKMKEHSLKNIDTKLKELQDLIMLQDKVNQVKYIEKRIKLSTEKITTLTSRLSNSEKNLDNKQLEKLTDDILVEICNSVSKLLVGWNLFPTAIVEFDRENTYDLVINNQPKRNFGKGFAAIINSAFSISIMLYCRNENLPYPKIIVLDSPLVTFKEKNTPIKDLGEKVPDDVKKNFYTELSKLVKEEQLIIIENVEPIEDLAGKMKIHHFTKTDGVGRYGFFPRNNDKVM